VDRVWVLRRSGVWRAKTGERYKGGAKEGNEGDEESVGGVLTCSSHFAPFKSRNVFWCCFFIITILLFKCLWGLAHLCSVLGISVMKR
jgi:hypothetical protein